MLLYKARILWKAVFEGVKYRSTKKNYMINIKTRCTVKANTLQMAKWWTVLYLLSILSFTVKHKLRKYFHKYNNNTSNSKKRSVHIEIKHTVELSRTLNRSKRSVHYVLLFIQYILSPDRITHMKYLHNCGLPLIHWLSQSRIILAAVKVLLITFFVCITKLQLDFVEVREKFQKNRSQS